MEPSFHAVRPSCGRFSRGAAGSFSGYRRRAGAHRGRDAGSRIEFRHRPLRSGYCAGAGDCRREVRPGSLRCRFPGAGRSCSGGGVSAGRWGVPVERGTRVCVAKDSAACGASCLPVGPKRAHTGAPRRGGCKTVGCGLPGVDGQGAAHCRRDRQGRGAFPRNHRRRSQADG